MCGARSSQTHLIKVMHIWITITTTDAERHHNVSQEEDDKRLPGFADGLLRWTAHRFLEAVANTKTQEKLNCAVTLTSCYLLTSRKNKTRYFRACEKIIWLGRGAVYNITVCSASAPKNLYVILPFFPFLTLNTVLYSYSPLAQTNNCHRQLTWLTVRFIPNVSIWTNNSVSMATKQ